MKFRKFTTGLLAAALLVSISGTALADDNSNVPGAMYGDTQAGGLNKPASKVAEDLAKAGIKDLKADHWAAGSVSVLVEAGLLAPDTEGNINVDAPVSTNEGIAVFAKVLGIASKTDDAATAAAKAQQAGLVSNVSADKDMSRLEVAKLLAAALGVQPKFAVTKENYPFSDFDSASPDDRAILAALYEIGVFKGYPDGRFDPSGVLTKAQIAILVDRILGAQ